MQRTDLKQLIDSARLNNLHAVVERLKADGIIIPAAQADLLSLHERRLTLILSRGAPMTTHEAREIEWCLNLRSGWMDVYPQYEP